MRKIFLMIAELLAFGLPLSAKVLVRNVAPLSKDGIKYSVTYRPDNFRDFYGQITIESKTDDIFVYTDVPVYKFTVKPALKDDVQWIFFNEMTFENDDTIRLVNGRNEVFLFNIKTYEVKCISGKTNCEKVQKSFESSEKKHLTDLMKKNQYPKIQPQKKRIESVNDLLERAEPLVSEAFNKEKIKSYHPSIIYHTKNLWHLTGTFENDDSTATGYEVFQIAFDAETGAILYILYTPLTTSSDYIETTHTGHFSLVGDKEKNTMTCVDNTLCFEKWQIPRYWPDEGSLLRLSNNGEYCVLNNKEEYCEKPFKKNDVLFWVYKNGHLYDTITRGRFIKELEKILGPDTKVSADLEVDVNDIYINGLRLETYYYDKEYDYAGADDDEFVPVHDIYLWYDFDTKNFLNSNKLRADQCKIAFDVLAKKFSDAEKLIDNKEHKEKFRRAFEKIMPFKKDAPTDTTYRWYVKTYADGNLKIQSIVPRDRFEGMEALERFVYFEDETKIDFFILDDVYDFAIRIQKGTEWEIEYRPAPPLIYMFDTKKGIVEIKGDYQEN